jgi:RNA 2',3'-cyclic 3'-phosphodiesterase
MKPRASPAWHVPGSIEAAAPSRSRGGLQPAALPLLAMTTPDVARLFLALWPDDAVRARLAAYRDAWRWPAGAKPVADEKLHLTLHFIGAFARDRIAALGEALAEVELEPLGLRAGSAEIWRGGIAVLSVAPAPALTALHARLGAALAGVGIALEARPFAPHVTLARKARGAEPPGDAAEIEWTARAPVLVESMRVPPSTYRVLFEVGSIETE